MNNGNIHEIGAFISHQVCRLTNYPRELTNENDICGTVYIYNCKDFEKSEFEKFV